jgi:PII-like signaling protein
MTTFTRVQAAEICQTSNRSISNWLNAFEEIHGLDGILENNQITELGLERLEERAAIGATAYREKYQSVEPTIATQDEPIEATIATDEPIGLTAGIALRTEEIHSTALATSRHTDELRAFEIPTIEIEDVSVDVEELRSLLGLSTSITREADAYREQARQHQAELETLHNLQEQLDIARIVADEQAKIAREQAIRDQVRKSELGKQIKAHAAVA